MKRFLTLILSIVIALQCTVFASAVTYEVNSRYTFDLSDDYYMAEENKFISKADASNFLVSFEPAADSELCVGDMSDKEIKGFADEMAQALNSVGAGMNIRVLSADKVKHPNGKNALSIILEQSPVGDGTAKYQKVYIFTCVENTITFSYTTTEKDALSKLDATFDSIEIDEKEAGGAADKIKTAVFYAGIFIVLTVVVVLFVKRRTK